MWAYKPPNKWFPGKTFIIITLVWNKTHTHTYTHNNNNHEWQLNKRYKYFCSQSIIWWNSDFSLQSFERNIDAACYFCDYWLSWSAGFCFTADNCTCCGIRLKGNGSNIIKHMIGTMKGVRLSSQHTLLLILYNTTESRTRTVCK